MKKVRNIQKAARNQQYRRYAENAGIIMAFRRNEDKLSAMQTRIERDSQSICRSACEHYQRFGRGAEVVFIGAEEWIHYMGRDHFINLFFDTGGTDFLELERMTSLIDTYKPGTQCVVIVFESVVYDGQTYIRWHSVVLSLEDANGTDD